MRRAKILPLAAVLAIAVAGCGGSDSSAPSTPQQQAVAKAYRDYIDAVKKGDGKAACSLLTPAFQRRAGRAVAIGSRSELKNVSCQVAIEKGTLPQIQQVIPNLERVKVDGVHASGFDPGEGQIGPQKVFFEKLDGGWRISRTVFFR